MPAPPFGPDGALPGIIFGLLESKAQAASRGAIDGRMRRAAVLSHPSPFISPCACSLPERVREEQRQGGEERDEVNEGEEQPPCSPSSPSSNRSRQLLLLHGPRDCESTFHRVIFQTVGTEGRWTKTWVFRTVRQRPPAKPARKYRQKAGRNERERETESESNASGKGDGVESARRMESDTQVKSRHCIVDAHRLAAAINLRSVWQIGAVVLASGIDGHIRRPRGAPPPAGSACNRNGLLSDAIPGQPCADHTLVAGHLALRDGNDELNGTTSAWRRSCAWAIWLVPPVSAVFIRMSRLIAAAGRGVNMRSHHNSPPTCQYHLSRYQKRAKSSTTYRRPACQPLKTRSGVIVYGPGKGSERKELLRQAVST
ncbi:hypothetical protein CCMA1212_005606 [Trichoderma ghanense]|uniref:Uncharacterized protein n=1 Tax=Trichoderma ghanense TaxID=65468 RepID=A0ABY2H4E6_9HYPO